MIYSNKSSSNQKESNNNCQKINPEAFKKIKERKDLIYDDDFRLANRILSNEDCSRTILPDEEISIIGAFTGILEKKKRKFVSNSIFQTVSIRKMAAVRNKLNYAFKNNSKLLNALSRKEIYYLVDTCGENLDFGHYIDAENKFANMITNEEYSKHLSKCRADWASRGSINNLINEFGGEVLFVRVENVYSPDKNNKYDRSQDKLNTHLNVMVLLPNMNGKWEDFNERLKAIRNRNINNSGYVKNISKVINYITKSNNQVLNEDIEMTDWQAGQLFNIYSGFKEFSFFGELNSCNKDISRNGHKVVYRRDDVDNNYKHMLVKKGKPNKKKDEDVKSATEVHNSSFKEEISYEEHLLRKEAFRNGFDYLTGLPLGDSDDNSDDTSNDDELDNSYIYDCDKGIYDNTFIVETKAYCHAFNILEPCIYIRNYNPESKGKFGQSNLSSINSRIDMIHKQNLEMLHSLGCQALIDKNYGLLKYAYNKGIRDIDLVDSLSDEYNNIINNIRTEIKQEQASIVNEEPSHAVNNEQAPIVKRIPFHQLQKIIRKSEIKQEQASIVNEEPSHAVNNEQAPIVKNEEAPIVKRIPFHQLQKIIRKSEIKQEQASIVRKSV